MLQELKGILNKISKGQCSPFILLSGDDNGLIKDVFKTISDAILKGGSPETNLEAYKEGHPEIPDIVSNIMTPPFFPGNKILALIDWDISGFEGKQVDSLANCIETGIPAGNYLVMVPEKAPDKRSRFYQQMSRNCEFLECKKGTKINESELPAILSEYFAERGFSINTDALRQLIIKSDFDYLKVKTEADKIILAFSSGTGKKITLNDVDRIVTSGKSAVIFDLLDAIGRKEAGKSVEIFRSLLRSKEKPEMVLFMISKRFHSFLQFYDFMAKMEVRKPSGRITYDMYMKNIFPLLHSFNENYLTGKGNLLTGHPFYIYNLMLAALNYSPESARKAVRALKGCDTELKSSGVSNNVIMEKLILSLVSS